MFTSGVVLRAARQEKKMSQDVLARLMGYTNSQFISNIERNLAQVPPKQYPRVAKILGIKVVEVLAEIAKKDEARSIDAHLEKARKLCQRRK